MKKRYLVTRHIGAFAWSSRLVRDADLQSLDPDLIEKGDIVYGTLPIAVAAMVIKNGGHFVNLTIDTPKALRGKELLSNQLTQYGARFEEYHVERRISSLDCTFDEVEPIAITSPLVLAMINTGEILSNILPALYYKRFQGIERVVIFSTNNDNRLKWLQSVLLNEGGVALSNIDVIMISMDYSALKKDMSAALGKYAKISTIFSNVTGGTKPMSLALTEVTRQLGGEAVYYDVVEQRLDLLLNHEKPIDVPEDLLTIKTWLAAYGQKDKPNDSATDALEFTDISKKIAKVLSKIGKCQIQPLYLAVAGLKKMTRGKQISKSTFHEDMVALLESDSVLIEMPPSDVILDFKSDYRKRFYGGAWFEYLVLDAMHKLGFDSAVAGVSFKTSEPNSARAGSEDENEIDVVAVHKNLPIIIECKTCNINPGDMQRWLNKLAAVGKRTASGLSRKILISLHEVKKGSYLSIAKKENISIVHGDGVLNSKNLQLALDSAIKKSGENIALSGVTTRNQ